MSVSSGGRDGKLILGYRVEALEVGSPHVGLDRPGGPCRPPALVLSLGAGPPPALSPPVLQALMICLPPFSREFKTCKPILERQESKMAHRGGQPSVRPGPAWPGYPPPPPAPPCPHFLVKQDASHQCLASSSRDDSDLTRSDYYQVPYKPAPESTCHTSTHSSEAQFSKETLGRALIPSTELAQVL